MKFTIISHRSVPSPELTRAGQLDTLILFTVENGESDAVIVAGANPTDAQITQAVGAKLTARGKNIGRTLEA